ncbi:MAG: hypothetical protein RL037_528 [Bacteroidota bacterium]|jgi:hypothetical protein
MFSFPILSFPPAKLELKKVNNSYSVRCLIRKKWIVLTPEEWVRQHQIDYMIHSLYIPISYIGVEKTIQYGQLKKRWDILVYSRSHEPYMLIECKATTIPLTKETLYQLLTYQYAVRSSFIGMTNGIDSVYYEISADKKGPLKQVDNLPNWT